MTQLKTVLCIFGTRPEAIKMVPVIRALQNSNWARCIVVATAQHRDLLDQMLIRFGITVNYDLNLMQPGQSPDQVLARMLPELAEIIQQEEPYAVLTQGDTATVFGAALAAIVRQVERLLNDTHYYQSMARVCMPYGDGTAGEKTVQLLAGQP